MVVHILLLLWFMVMLLLRFNLFLLIIIYLNSDLVLSQSDIFCVTNIIKPLLLLIRRVDLSPLLFQDVVSALKEGGLGKD
jgi:hypothetical protein